MGGTGKVFDGDVDGFLSETSPIGPRTCQPRTDPLRNPCPLELGDRGQDMHLQLARGRGGIDAFLQRDKRDPQRLELVEQRDQMLQAATESIQPPTDQDIELASLDIRENGIQGRSTLPTPRHAPINELDRGPAPNGDVAPELGELVLRLLVERRDPRIDSCSLGGGHDDTPALRI